MIRGGRQAWAVLLAITIRREPERGNDVTGTSYAAWGSENIECRGLGFGLINTKTGNVLDGKRPPDLVTNRGNGTP